MRLNLNGPSNLIMIKKNVTDLIGAVHSGGRSHSHFLSEMCYRFPFFFVFFIFEILGHKMIQIIECSYVGQRSLNHDKNCMTTIQ